MYIEVNACMRESKWKKRGRKIERKKNFEIYKPNEYIYTNTNIKAS